MLLTPRRKFHEAVHLISISPISLNIRGSHCGNPISVVTLVMQSFIATRPRWPEVSRYPGKIAPLPPSDLHRAGGQASNKREVRGIDEDDDDAEMLTQVDSCQQRLLIHVV